MSQSDWHQPAPFPSQPRLNIVLGMLVGVCIAVAVKLGLTLLIAGADVQIEMVVSTIVGGAIAGFVVTVGMR